MWMMKETEREKLSKRRRAFLIAVGYAALALDKLEGKSTKQSVPATRGRIKIVS
jgi:hypothetical protein